MSLSGWTAFKDLSEYSMETQRYNHLRFVMLTVLLQTRKTYGNLLILNDFQFSARISQFYIVIRRLGQHAT